MTTYSMRSLLTLEVDLNRPEHMPSPEGYISALAWSQYGSSQPGVDESTWLAYQSKEQSTLSNRRLEFTAPEATKLQVALKQHGLEVNTQKYSSAASAVLNSIIGMRITQTKSQPVSPLTPSLALLQNPRGVMAKDNPPNFAAIFEKIFLLGSAAEAGAAVTVSGLWKRSAERRMENDPLLRVIDNSIQHGDVTIVGARVDSPRSAKQQGAESLMRPPVFIKSPFGWFNLCWTRLNSDDWVDALPSKVWVDWAMCLLRAGVGFSYLWEASWYNKLAEMIIDPDITALSSLVESPIEIMPWVSSREDPEVRNVSSRMKWKTINGQMLRAEINRFFVEHGLLEMSFQDALEKASADRQLVDELIRIRQIRTGKALPWEAVTSALTIRASSPGDNDYYGFWRKNGPRITYVEPATEWLAVLASLSSDHPESVINLGDVMQNLRILGLRPAVREVVGLLENAGLARGSDDADLGLKIETAY
jgi:hypothetical protein